MSLRAPQPRPVVLLDILLRLVGGVLTVALGAGFALLEAVSTPGPWFMPIPAALVSNVFLVWFARSTVDRWWAWLLAAVPWFVVMVLAVSPTDEGDQLANSWTGLGTFAAGALGFFVPIALRRPADVIRQTSAQEKMGVSGISR